MDWCRCCNHLQYYGSKKRKPLHGSIRKCHLRYSLYHFRNNQKHGRIFNYGRMSDLCSWQHSVKRCTKQHHEHLVSTQKRSGSGLGFHAARSAGAGAGQSVFGVSSIPLTGSGGRKTGWREGWTPRSAPRRRWRREPGRGTDRSRRPGRTAQWWRCLRRWHTPER